MRAILCRQFGPPATLALATDAPRPTPGPREVLVEVEAAGVNFADTLLIEGRYQARPPFPFAPGGEIAGRVAALGEGVAGLAPGQRVMGMIGHGGFADHATASADILVPVPAGVTALDAAALPYAYGTTLHALRHRGTLQAGETLLVLGAGGGAGLGAVQLGKLLGARVIAAASPAKHAACTAAGADAALDYTADGWRDVLRGLAPGGVDVTYDAVGGAYTETALRALGWGGRHLVVGFAAGEIPRPPLNLTLLKGASIVGVFYGDYAKRDPAGNRALLGELLDWVRQGRLKPALGRVWPLAEAPAALAALAERRAIGKQMIAVRD